MAPFSFVVIRNSKPRKTGSPAGVVFRAQSDVGIHWMMSLHETRATSSNVARLMALLVVDEAVQVLEGRLFPPEPGTGFLLDNGALWDKNGHPLPPATNKEIARIAAVLEEKHPSYLETIQRFLRGESEAGFGPVPEGLPLTLSQGREGATAPAPPSVVVAGDWREHRRNRPPKD